MNEREFLTAVLNANLSDEMNAYAQKGIDKLDATNAKRRAKAAEKSAANAPLVDKIVEFVGAEPLTARDLMAKFTKAGITREEGKTWNVQFVSTLARKAVATGKVATVDVKVKGKGIQRGYVAAH